MQDPARSVSDYLGHLTDHFGLVRVVRFGEAKLVIIRKMVLARLFSGLVLILEMIPSTSSANIVLAADNAELTTTKPSHYSDGVTDPALRLRPVREPRQLRIRAHPSSFLLQKSATRSITEMTYDKGLSELCRRRRFRQRQDRQFIVQLAGEIYGASIGGHPDLFDPERRATPNQIYAFRYHNSGRCQVYKVASTGD